MSSDRFSTCPPLEERDDCLPDLVGRNLQTIRVRDFSSLPAQNKWWQIKNIGIVPKVFPWKSGNICNFILPYSYNNNFSDIVFYFQKKQGFV